MRIKTAIVAAVTAAALPLGYVGFQAACGGDDAKPAAGAASAGVAKASATPLGLPPVPVPADNPMTPGEGRTGRDALLRHAAEQGRHGLLRHLPRSQAAWAEHEPTSKGIGEPVGGRNSPTVINAAYATSQFWDGRAATLEEQALGPIENPIEMGHRARRDDRRALEDRGLSRAVPEGLRHRRHRRRALPRPSPPSSGRSSAATRLRPLQGRRQDRPERGAEARPRDVRRPAAPPATRAAVQQLRLLQRRRGHEQAEARRGPQGRDQERPDPGKFRVPALREVAKTAPYFHDGSARRWTTRWP